MNAIRQDAWTEHDDQRLADITLRHIREGGTQLSAFAEVGMLIGRTQAACGFRWNSYLRKVYENEVKVAKQDRQKMQISRRSITLKRKAAPLTIHESSDMPDLQTWVEQIRGWSSRWRELQLEMAEMNEELRRLRKENEDYRSLLQLLDRARTLQTSTS